MRLVKANEIIQTDSAVNSNPSYSSMKEAEAMALRDHNVGGEDNMKHDSEDLEQTSPQYINIQRGQELVNVTKNLLNSSILTTGEFLVDINGDLISSNALEKYIPQQYDDELLHDDLTEDDKRLAAALVAVQLVNQHKQQTGNQMLPVLDSSTINVNSKDNQSTSLTSHYPKINLVGQDKINDKTSAASIAHMVTNYIQAVEDENQQVLPPLKKVLSRNRYMRSQLAQLSDVEHQVNLESLGIHTETDAVEISPEEIEIAQTDVKDEDFVIPITSAVKLEDQDVQYIVEEEEEQESDVDADPDFDSDMIHDNQPSRRSLPHKKRIPRKLKNPKKSQNHQHQAISSNSKGFKCNKCPQSFMSQSELLTHKLTHCLINKPQVLSQATFSCELCFRAFTNQWKFFEHLKFHYEPLEVESRRTLNKTNTQTDGKQNKPQASTQEILNKWMTTTHLQDVTITPKASVQLNQTSGCNNIPTVWECQACNRIFRRQKTFETHIIVAHPKQEEIEEFSDPEDMMEGIKVQVNSDDDKDCQDKDSETKDWYREEDLHAAEADLQAMEVDNKLFLHVCEICHEGYETKAVLNTHINTQHSDLMSAITKTVRRDISRSQDGTAKKGNLGCKQCGRLFHHRNSLMYHLKSHLGERPHQCEVCGKGFFATSALKVHMRQHSGVKPYKCEFCGRNFRQWGDLKYHCISIHSDQKNFQCEFCGKHFARKYSLTVHSRIHTGERNYKCEFCDKTFRASTYLQNHRKIHTGEKPHSCEICGKPFRVRSDMKRHMITHSKEITFYHKNKDRMESANEDSNLVIQVDEHSASDIQKDNEIEVSTVESILPDETTEASSRLQEALTATYAPRDQIVVWPVYMT